MQSENMPKVVVLRWGHRLHRDERLTTHVALTARALGGSGLILANIEDGKIKETIGKVTKNWGGQFFFEMGTPWKEAVNGWKAKGGIVVHLTAYGENIQTSDVLQRIKKIGKDILVVVGSQKVPSEFFSEAFSDFNVAIGNQPHSECASLAVFLDHLFEGEELGKSFEHAKLRIIPQKRGKKIEKICSSN
jgi:tRNA (cytidine56-2'-O)-methyltransferase